MIFKINRVLLIKLILNDVFKKKILFCLNYKVVKIKI